MMPLGNFRCSRIGTVLLCLTASRGAYAAYEYRYGYSRYHSNSPIISLELDERKSRDLDLRIAAREDRGEDVMQYLNEGADVNAQSDQGETALMYSARHCAIHSAHILLNRHADINERDNHGRTALMYAVMEGCVPVTRLLLKERKILLQVRDDQHLSAIDYAKQGTELDVDGPSVEILTLIKRAWTRKFR